MRIHIRGTSEPPVTSNSSDTESTSDFHSSYDELSGLRRNGFPIKIAGIAMGSLESLNSADEFSLPVEKLSDSKPNLFRNKVNYFESNAVTPFGVAATKCQSRLRGGNFRFPNARHSSSAAKSRNRSSSQCNNAYHKQENLNADESIRSIGNIDLFQKPSEASTKDDDGSHLPPTRQMYDHGNWHIGGPDLIPKSSETYANECETYSFHSEERNFRMCNNDSSIIASDQVESEKHSENFESFHLQNRDFQSFSNASSKCPFESRNQFNASLDHEHRPILPRSDSKAISDLMKSHEEEEEEFISMTSPFLRREKSMDSNIHTNDAMDSNNLEASSKEQVSSSYNMSVSSQQLLCFEDLFEQLADEDEFKSFSREEGVDQLDPEIHMATYSRPWQGKKPSHFIKERKNHQELRKISEESNGPCSNLSPTSHFDKANNFEAAINDNPSDEKFEAQLNFQDKMIAFGRKDSDQVTADDNNLDQNLTREGKNQKDLTNISEETAPNMMCSNYSLDLNPISQVDIDKIKEVDNFEIINEDTIKKEHEFPIQMNFQEKLSRFEETTSDQDTDESSYNQDLIKEKCARKRIRNRTIDYHDLSPRVWNYNGQVAKYIQKTYLPNEHVEAGENALDPEAAHELEPVPSGKSGLGNGLQIILTKLRNIETKLDEIKTMEQNIWMPDAEPPSKSPNVEATISVSKEEHHHQMEDKSCNTSFAMGDASETDVTFIVDDSSESMEDKGDSGDEKSDPGTKEDLLVNSPSSLKAPCLSSSYVDLISLSSEDLEEDKLDEEKRNERIERLAKQLMTERQVLSIVEESHNTGLDTLSERSEEETEENRKSGNNSNASNHQALRRLRSRRTRSASRDRSLAKIRYCWRCHQTGHESFDCRAELHPGNWCPRCLETSHWEDDCWVHEKQVLCSICTLPGHLPCVHETKDFRQRKLVIETFGWLAFKEWFRESDFWSWWNVSGYTNVPLYKLMQYHT